MKKEQFEALINYIDRIITLNHSRDTIPSRFFYEECKKAKNLALKSYNESMQTDDKSR